jgi:signal transduction histidine kinase
VSAALLLWSGIIAASWWWSYSTHRQHLVELAKTEAATNINKDWSFRLWATSHGGVYVPPDEKTPPNPYLAKIPDRDIITDSGKRLTLMNPAYMMRQIMQGYSELYGVKGHITSMALTNPVNQPDAWEMAALKSFQQGLKEMATVTEIDGKPFLRMMRPIIMEKGCMKCHADTGIKVGEIRGGISTAIPMEPLYDASRLEMWNVNLIHGAVWLLGASVIIFIARRIRRENDAINQLNRELEQRVVERTSQLEAANKELESFAYSVSHDLRVPLRAIDGFSALVVKQYEGQVGSEGKRLLNEVRNNVRRMGQLIEDILAFSRAGRLEIKASVADMEVLAHEVWQELGPLMAGRDVRLEIKPLPKVRGDAALLRQVWVNLLANAAKFTGSRVNARVEAGGSVEGGECTFYVKDNGVGFDQQQVGRLFGVFQRLHSVEEFEGTGIGLAIVKRIIARHGGRVWAEGKVDEGATFYFSLPVE